MSVNRTIVLLPGHGLEDLPGQLKGDMASEFLSVWTSAWHPELIHRAGVPEWCAADQLKFERSGSLLLIAETVKGWLTQECLLDAKANGSIVVESSIERHVVIGRILAALDLEARTDAPLVADFLAFGYWYLQTELLSYQLRYTSGLDQGVVSEPLVAAAAAAVDGDVDKAKSSLAAAFGILTDQRTLYYPVDSYLLDLTLVEKFNCGQPLCTELASGYQRNIWMTGATLEHLAEQEPRSLDALKTALSEGRTELIGGELNELPTSLVPRRELANNVHAGQASFRQHLNLVPTIFARRRFGLGPVWPSILKQARFDGAIHATFDDGVMPGNLQPRGRWRGSGPAEIEICGSSAIDASLPESALELGDTMGRSMESDFVATVVLARWAGQRTVWLDDLELGQRYL